MNRETHLPGPEEDLPASWYVWREDIHGNQYRMPTAFDTEEAAAAYQIEFTNRGHHQTYTVKPDCGDGVEAILNDGTTLQAS